MISVEIKLMTRQTDFVYWNLISARVGLVVTQFQAGRGTAADEL